ncbi:MAG: methionine synthase [Xenococcaceae cyanobacterium MO_234.B1]|nr:methionine synthase [Xenococcaceae cyanobacterium MO_234.B1]
MNQKRGIYITANDKVIEQAIALLNSIRLHDPATPIVLIPYDDNYQALAQILVNSYDVKLFPDLDFINRLSRKLYDIFGSGFFARPNQFRKQACWFGEFDEFLYIDTDIVVFEKIIDNLNYLKDYDFLCCDYQHLGGIKNVFTSQVIEQGVFTATELLDIFNGGFWASKKNLITEQDLYNTFAECAAHPEYFDFSQKTSDQPIINYMLLKRVPRRFNLVRREKKAPGSWAGSKHFQQQEYILIDPNIGQPLQYLHWAGIKIQPGCPYWDIWKYYRYLGEPNPPADPPITPPQQEKNVLRKVLSGGWNKLKQINQ